MVTMAMVMVMDMAMVMDTMDNLENKIFMLCRELSMDELEQLAKKLKFSIKGFQSLLIFEIAVPCFSGENNRRLIELTCICMSYHVYTFDILELKPH